jgi:hypothetical protein
VVTVALELFLLLLVHLFNMLVAVVEEVKNILALSLVKARLVVEMVRLELMRLLVEFQAQAV